MHLKNKNIAIVGGGLVGSLLSTYLSRQGAIVSVFDKRSDIRLDGNSSGRSINLALSNRGINALSTIGVSQSILKIAMPMYKRVMHSLDGGLTEQQYGKKSEAIYSISRHLLNAKLMNIAEKKLVKYFFNKECVSIDIASNTLIFSDETKNTYDYIFGADGAGSIIRKKMSQSSKKMNSTVKFINSSYKELTIPANSDGTHKIDNTALHIWPRKSFMVIALPNLDGTFTCTLFAPNKGLNSFASLVNSLDVDSFFCKYFKDLKQIIPNLSEQYFLNPTSPLGFVRCSSWKDHNTILIGDACHATVPFYGQGMNSGFEDCFLLNQWLDIKQDLGHPDIDVFLQNRIMDTTAMQDLSMHNFIEMRDKTANTNFLLQKKIEEWFSNKHPQKWEPLYSMVTFSDMRYSEALQRGKIQNKIMSNIMRVNNLNNVFSVAELEQKKIEQQILDYLI